MTPTAADPDRPEGIAVKCHVDGTRRRRHSPDPAKRLWYAGHRCRRFARYLLSLAADDGRPARR
jgi:hypothetical protein